MKFSNRLHQLFHPLHRKTWKLIQVESTLQCSLDCVMCPWSDLRKAGPQVAGNMTWETFSCVAASFPQAESVDLTGGGEPLLHPRLVEMARLAKSAGCETGFSTNGSRLSPEISDQLITAGLDWISFSIDAATPGLYERIRRGSSFEQVIANIDTLQKLKDQRNAETPRMYMVFVMMGGGAEGDDSVQNFQELPAFISLAKSLGVEQVIAKNLDVILKEGDDDRRLFSHTGSALPEVRSAVHEAHNLAKDLGVGLRLYNLAPEEQAICEHNPLRSVFVTCTGQVSPCITLAYAGERIFDGLPVTEPCLHFGNVNEESLESIWNKPDYKAFRGIYEQRQKQAGNSMMDALLGIDYPGDAEPVPAPEGCRTCYYLYGI